MLFIYSNISFKIWFSLSPLTSTVISDPGQIFKFNNPRILLASVIKVPFLRKISQLYLFTKETNNEADFVYIPEGLFTTVVLVTKMQFTLQTRI